MADNVKQELLTQIVKDINKILDDDPQLELQVNRGHWERILPIILAKAEPLIRKDEREEITEWLEFNAPEYVWQRFKDNINIRKGKP